MSASAQPVMNPEISIVIPMYNAGKTIRKCLDSIFATAGADIEVIVVNDNSSDGCEKIVEEYSCKLITVPARRNLGAGATRNLGARAATGEIIYFTDADIIQTRDTLRRIAAAFREQADLDIVAGIYSKDPANTGFGPNFVALKTFYFANRGPARKEISFVQSGCFAMRRRVFVESQGFYNKRAGEEYEYGHRLARKHKIIMDKNLVVIHHHPYVLERLVEITRRAFYWFPLFLKRLRFETDGGTGSRQEGLSALLVYMSFLALVFSLALPGFAAEHSALAGTLVLAPLAIVLAMNYGLYRFMLEERSLAFMFPAILTDLLLYVGVGCGASAAFLVYCCKALARRLGFHQFAE